MQMYKLILTVFDASNEVMAQMTYQKHHDRLLLESVIENKAAGFEHWCSIARGLYVRRDYSFVPQVVAD